MCTFPNSQAASSSYVWHRRSLSFAHRGKTQVFDLKIIQKPSKWALCGLLEKSILNVLKANMRALKALLGLFWCTLDLFWASFLSSFCDLKKKKVEKPAIFFFYLPAFSSLLLLGHTEPSISSPFYSSEQLSGSFSRGRCAPNGP